MSQNIFSFDEILLLFLNYWSIFKRIIDYCTSFSDKMSNKLFGSTQNFDDLQNWISTKVYSKPPQMVSNSVLNHKNSTFVQAWRSRETLLHFVLLTFYPFRSEKMCLKRFFAPATIEWKVGMGGISNGWNLPGGKKGVSLFFVVVHNMYSSALCTCKTTHFRSCTSIMEWIRLRLRILWKPQEVWRHAKFVSRLH